MSGRTCRGYNLAGRLRAAAWFMIPGYAIRNWGRRECLPIFIIS